MADAGATQLYYRVEKGKVTTAYSIVASPKPLPRVAVPDDGSYSMIGQFKLSPTARFMAQFPNAITSRMPAAWRSIRAPI